MPLSLPKNRSTGNLAAARNLSTQDRSRARMSLDASAAAAAAADLEAIARIPSIFAKPIRCRPVSFHFDECDGRQYRQLIAHWWSIKSQLLRRPFSLPLRVFAFFLVRQSVRGLFAQPTKCPQTFR
ncbi:hypothetical protein LB503_012323 [Fusarium chuoi]|nr:hypothetical protein LB503_012323 [Fusarium chuoi]